MKVLVKEDEDPETEVAAVGEKEALKPTKPLSGIKRDITDIKELMKSEAAIKLLLGERDRLENDVIELSQFRDKFHQVDTERAVLLERNIKTKRLELLFNVCLAVGTALIVLNPRLDNNFFWLGAVLLIFSVISWLWQWWQK
jgi:hypothetical protein